MSSDPTATSVTVEAAPTLSQPEVEVDTGVAVAIVAKAAIVDFANKSDLLKFVIK